jgi:predicted transposase YbfD/YdcC
MVDCERSFKNKPDEIQLKTRFYISSKKESASYFGICTRNHWSIENQLHWYLDIVFAEDRQRTRKDHAPENMATLRKMALQILLENKGKNSLKKVRKCAAWNDEFLVEVLKTIPT